MSLARFWSRLSFRSLFKSRVRRQRRLRFLAGESSALYSLRVEQLESRNLLAVLTVNVLGNGAGVVTSSPAGINTQTTPSANFTDNSTVQLTASPATGSTFSGWSGACTGTGGCMLTMDANKSVNASFTY